VQANARGLGKLVLRPTKQPTRLSALLAGHSSAVLNFTLGSSSWLKATPAAGHCLQTDVKQERDRGLARR